MAHEEKTAFGIKKVPADMLEIFPRTDGTVSICFAPQLFARSLIEPLLNEIQMAWIAYRIREDF